MIGIVVGASGSAFERFGNGAFTEVSGSCCGEGERFGLLDGMIGGISGEGERCGCNGFTGASSALLSPSESSTG